MSEKRLQAVLFDLGGTLVTIDSFSAASAGLKGAQRAYAALKERGTDLPSSLSFYQKVMIALGKVATYGGGPEEVRLEEEIARLFAEAGKPLGDDDLRVAVAAWHEPFGAKLRPRPGLDALLGQLRDLGLRLGIVSNSVWPGWVIEGEIAAAGLSGWFDPVVVSSDAGVRKPDPKIFQTGLDAVGASAAETAFVGNSLHEDVSGARFAGMHTVYYNESGPADDAGLADVEITDLAELPGVIRTWLAPHETT
jgi:putative hydrolase of the HAD superfamily